MDIHVIKATETNKERLKVAAYARVSTTQDEQQDSLDNQIRHYRDHISNDPEYELVNVYFDFGISGYKEKRPGFQKMIEDARAGKIDLIITKSITRFARNTDTVLKTTRELKDLGVGVFFELQNINTMTSEGELLMTVYAAFAQAESESASELQKMAYRRRMQEGRPRKRLQYSLGYRLDGNGECVPDQNAKWVVKMYELAADGYTCAQIAKYLNEHDVKPTRADSFTSSIVSKLLRSVVYKGDAIMQQYYSNEERKQVLNRGELPMVYIKDAYPPIVSQKLWDDAQKMLDKRMESIARTDEFLELTDENYPYRNRMFCAECGHKLFRRLTRNKRGKIIWYCSGTGKNGKSYCNGVNVPDPEVRSWGRFEGNIYISAEIDDLGKRTFTFVDEETWSKDHVKKEQPKIPALSTDIYPFLGKVYCKRCGMQLTRRLNSKGVSRWYCLGRQIYGTEFCEGISVPEDLLLKVGEPESKIYVGKEIINGEERYGYTSKPDQIKPRGKRRKKKEKSSSVLQSVHGSGRANE